MPCSAHIRPRTVPVPPPARSPGQTTKFVSSPCAPAVRIGSYTSAWRKCEIRSAIPTFGAHYWGALLGGNHDRNGRFGDPVHLLIGDRHLHQVTPDAQVGRKLDQFHDEE